MGFIGSNLVRELNNRGHETWACDLMHSYQPNYVRCDVGKFSQVERLFNEHNFDYVYHAAAEYGRWNGEDYYENLWATNATGTKNILRVQEKKKFRMIFFGEGSLRKAIHEYVAHYHGERNHQGLGNRIITPDREHSSGSGSIHRRQRLGGLPNYYYRAAA